MSLAEDKQAESDELTLLEDAPRQFLDNKYHHLQFMLNKESKIKSHLRKEICYATEPDEKIYLSLLKEAEERTRLLEHLAAQLKAILGKLDAKSARDSCSLYN